VYFDSETLRNSHTNYMRNIGSKRRQTINDQHMTKKVIRLIKMWILFCFLIIPGLKAQTTTTLITNKFFKIYSIDPIKAVDFAFSTNKWFEQKQDDVSNLKSKLKNLIDSCGAYCNYEKLTERTAGQSLIVITYLIKYERKPIRFTFTLYKADKFWQVNNFSFDENLGNELEDAAKLYRLKENPE